MAARACATPGGNRMQNKSTALAIVACLSLEACSSRPREFEPMLATPSANQAEFQAAYATCRQLLVDGKLDSNGRSGSLGAGAGAGAGTAAVGGTAAAVAGGWGGVALASATIVLLPFAVVGGAWGMSRAKRAKKERAIKTAMGGCLHDRGFEVAGWSRPAKKAAVAPSAAVQ